MLRLRKGFLSVVLSMSILGSSVLPVFAQEEQNADCNHDVYVLVDDTYYTLDEYLEKLNAEVDGDGESEPESSTIQPYLFGCTNVLGHKWEWGSWRGGEISHDPVCQRGFTGEYLYAGCKQTITRKATCSRTHCDATNSESDVLIVWCEQ